MMRLCGLAAIGMVLFGTAVLAETISISMSGTGVMTSPDGEVRLLLSAPELPPLDDIAISEARLRMPIPAAALDRSLRVEVWPVRSAWTPGVVGWNAWETPGGDFHQEWRGHMEMQAGDSRAELGLDVTNVMRAVAEGVEFHGFLFAVPRAYGAGFDADHAALIETALGGAVLDMKYRHAPKPVRPPR